MASKQNLSTSDYKVLAQVFDPETSPEKPEILVDPSLPVDRNVPDDLLPVLRAKEKMAIRLIETFETTTAKAQPSQQQQQQQQDDGVVAEDDRDRHETYLRALAVLDDVVHSCPTYASARNNRAQLRRWRFGDRGMLCRRRRRPHTAGAGAGAGAAAAPPPPAGATDENPASSRVASANAESHPSPVSVVEDAVADAAAATKAEEAGRHCLGDLRVCISLASPARASDPVSPAQGRLLAQAHTQLGAMMYAAARDMCEAGEDGPGLLPLLCDDDLSNYTRAMVEEEASRLFYLGGLYGNEVAQALAVHANPHAKLCGNIVREAMRKEMELSMAA